MLPLDNIRESLREDVRSLCVGLFIDEIEVAIREVLMQPGHTDAVCSSKRPASGIATILADEDRCLVILVECQANLLLH